MSFLSDLQYSKFY